MSEIRPEQSVELLKALHILTRDGKLNQDSRRKLKQIEHLLQFIAPLLDDTRAQLGETNLVDFGAGKSYLGFLLYDRHARSGNDPIHIFGIETRDDLVEKSRQLAEHFGFSHMRFLALAAAESRASMHLPERIDVVTALHACNTATDEALRFALARRARHVVLVPCCQAEVARELNAHKGQALADPLAEIWRHPIHTREFGSHITNVLRCLMLEAHGYQLRVTELVGWEHAMKNELIIASHSQRSGKAAGERLKALRQRLGLETLAHRFFTPEEQAA